MCECHETSGHSSRLGGCVAMFTTQQISDKDWLRLVHKVDRCWLIRRWINKKTRPRCLFNASAVICSNILTYLCVWLFVVVYSQRSCFKCITIVIIISILRTIKAVYITILYGEKSGRKKAYIDKTESKWLKTSYVWKPELFLRGQPLRHALWSWND